MQAELRGARRRRPRPRRRHRAPAVVLRAVPAAAPDDVLPHGPHRALPGDRRRPPAALDGLRRQPRRGRRARRADAPRRPGAAGGSPTPSRTRSTRSSRPSGGRSTPRASSVTPNRARLPALAGRVAERVDAARPAHRPLRRSSSTCSARWTRRSPATSPSPATSSATSRRSRWTTACARSIRWCVAAGPRAVTTTSLVTGGSGYFGSAARRRARRRAATTCGCSTSTSPAPTTLGVEVVAADIRDAGGRAGGGRRRRRRVPQRRPGAAGPRRRRCCARSTSTARPRCSTPARDAGVGKVVHTSSSAVFGVPGVEPGAADDGAVAGRGLRPRQARRRVGLPAGRRRRAST